MVRARIVQLGMDCAKDRTIDAAGSQRLYRDIAAPGTQAFRGAKHLLRYLAGKQDMYRSTSYHPHQAYDWRNGDFPDGQSK